MKSRIWIVIVNEWLSFLISRIRQKLRKYYTRDRLSAETQDVYMYRIAMGSRAENPEHAFVWVVGIKTSSTNNTSNDNSSINDGMRVWIFNSTILTQLAKKPDFLQI